MDRVRSALFMPIVVFPICAIVAIAIGIFLHKVHDATEHMGEVGEFMTPLAALVLVVIITAAGFIAAGRSEAATH